MKTLGRIAMAGLTAAVTMAASPPTETQAGEPAALTIEVTDREGRPVGDVVVYAQRNGIPAHQTGATAVSPAMDQAVMDQVDKRFEPHILVTQVGTRVSFPNNDTVSHHVYSFSEAKSFELPLYKGTAHPPVLFDSPGLVVIGCNIHDNMLGYVVVLDTPYFSKTDVHGRTTLEGLPAGEYSIHVWTPRLRTSALPAAKTMRLGDAEERNVAFSFSDRLFPPHAPDDGSLTWSAY